MNKQEAINFWDYAIKTPEEALQLLNSGNKGLTEEAANKRLATSGFNEIASKKNKMV